MNDYYTNVDITYLTKRLRISKTIRTCVYILFIFIMLTLAANIGTRLWLYGQSNNSVITLSLIHIFLVHLKPDNLSAIHMYRFSPHIYD